MECSQEKNKKNCGCTYSSCSKRGLCCQCISYHHSRNELPGCLFPAEVEKKYDRSREAYIRAYTK